MRRLTGLSVSTVSEAADLAADVGAHHAPGRLRLDQLGLVRGAVACQGAALMSDMKRAA
jgi:hypothetical protein